MKEQWPSGVRERAAAIEALHSAVHHAYKARDGATHANKAWSEAAASFRSAVEAFYAPYEEVLAGVRAGRTEEIEQATRFLVADPWCFRSGYLKEEMMHALANTPLPHHVIQPLRQVVLHRIADPQPRLLRYAAQLAANLWDEDFETQIGRLQYAGSSRERLAAALVDARARQRIQSLAGQAQRPRDAPIR